MAASSPARSQMGEDHSDAGDRSLSPSVYTRSEAGDGRGADDDPCEAAFDRLPDEIIQQYARRPSSTGHGTPTRLLVRLLLMSYRV